MLKAMSLGVEYQQSVVEEGLGTHHVCRQVVLVKVVKVVLRHLSCSHQRNV